MSFLTPINVVGAAGLLGVLVGFVGGDAPSALWQGVYMSLWMVVTFVGLDAAGLASQETEESYNRNGRAFLFSIYN